MDSAVRSAPAGAGAPAPESSAPALAELEVAVLGPVEVRRGGDPLDLGTPKQRALVTALALSLGRPVSVDAIIDLLWEDAPPPAATATLQAYVSALRKVLEPRRERRAPASVLVTTAPGYALRVPLDACDAVRFDRTVTEEHTRLAGPLLGPAPVPGSVLRSALDRLDDALAMWRGTPYAELEEAPGAVAERAHLSELRAVALEDRAVARLALGEHARAAAELEAMTTAYPLRERLWALRALALVRSGRQADALEVLRQLREVLDEELGLDPGVELRELQERVLRQDPMLEWVPPPDELSVSSASAAPAPRPSGPTQVAPTGDGVALLTAPADWPMLGRDRELAELSRALDQAIAGRTTCAVVTGEPGIGKSRLCSELAAVAADRGARVLLGRCSQDDGAPPLWPWRTVLDRLHLELPAQHEGAGSEFRTWDHVVRSIRAAALQQPTVLVLDDLQWADTATLRVLRLLVDSAQDDRLLVVATWRDRPRPEGALADLAEALARLHAVRLELTGLDETAVAGIVDAVTHRRPSGEQADALREHTDGNPFFLIEYARLAGSRGDLHRLLTGANPPTAVQEVLGRRLDRLPEVTVASLRAAAVAGREFDVPLLAGTTGIDEDDVLDHVEPAIAAGLVREDGVDRFTFAHALVRDTIYAGISPSRRARQHARIAAYLAERPGRETEEARHWLAAGPAHADRAWRSAAAAGRVAREAHAYQEAADLCCAGLRSLAKDPAATLRDRYHLLMELVSAYRWATKWNELTRTVEQAIAVAEQIGDPVLVAEAAISTTQGALWQVSGYGEVHDGIVAALRRSLDTLPPGDSALRCRCMLSLANELYYGAGFAERRALIDEALAMARRIDDPALLLDACQVAFVTLWSPRTAHERLDLATEAVSLARATGDEQATVVSLCLRSVVLNELGRPAEMWASVAEARAEAERLRIAYGLLVLDTLAIPWRAMAGDFDTCRKLADGLHHIGSRASLKQSDDAIAGAFMHIEIWEGRSADVVGVLRAMADPLPVTSTVITCLWRGGKEDEARSYYADHPVELGEEDWYSSLNWCNAAATALFMGDAELGARVYALLAPLAGTSSCAASGNASGPVDGYLAMAAAAVGETELATRHADDAERLAAEWQIPLFADWLRLQRDRYRF